MVLTLVNATDYIRLHTRAAPLLAALRFTLGSLDASRDAICFGGCSVSHGRPTARAVDQTTELRLVRIFVGSLTSESEERET